jgi:hypothetical protein
MSRTRTRTHRPGTQGCLKHPPAGTVNRHFFEQDFIMNSKQLFAAAAIALIGSTSAFAQEATSDAWLNIAATKSRTQVAAELAQARQDGTTKAWSAGYIEKLKVSKTRAEVVVATLAARQTGELDTINSEVYAFNPQAVQAGVRLAKSGH